MGRGPIRIASGQGFWGDWLEAPGRQVTGGAIDYLMMDYLAEVTMSIMQKQRSRDPSLGYAKDFVPLMAQLLPDLVERGVRVTANAGGVNPRACADALLEAARHRGLAGRVRVGIVTGDDLLERLDDLVARGHPLANMDTGEPLSVSPLTWSHAEYVRTVREYIVRHARANICPTCGQTMRDHVRHSDQVPMLTGTAAGAG